MKIIVKSEELNIYLPFPNFIFTNKVSFKIFLHAIQDYVDLSNLEEEKLYHFLKKAVKMYPGLTLVDVESADGECVKITL